DQPTTPAQKTQSSTAPITAEGKDSSTSPKNSTSALAVTKQSSVFGGGHDGRTAKMQRATQEKNPLALKTFEERGASIEAKLIRLNNDERYKKLGPKDRIMLRAQIYDKYVIPSFKEAGVQAPDIKTWLKGTKHD